MTPTRPSATQPAAGSAPAALPQAPLWLLVLITFSGTLAMHIFVPALPYAAQDLGASIAEMQLTVSLYILGLAAGQLFYGPISDRYGRRPTLMAGLVLYTVAGLAAALAPQAHALIAARLFQAMGGCAGLVLGRAIVRDTSEPEHAARRLSTMNLMMSVGPGLAPLVGGLVAASQGWRAVLFLLCGLGLFNLLATWRLLPETRRPGTNLTLAALRVHYMGLLRSRAFIGFTLAGSCATTPNFAFIASAPFIFTHQFHRPMHEVGLYLMVLISGVSLGSAVSGRLVGRVTLERLYVLANGVGLVAVSLLFVMAMAGHLDWVSLIVGMFFYTLGVGIASPTAMSLSLGVNRHVIGSASGLYGCVQMLVGALATALAGLGGDPTRMTLLVLVVAGVLGQAAFAVARRAPVPMHETAA